LGIFEKDYNFFYFGDKIMTIAVIKTGGKQYKVSVGDILNIELVDEKKDKSLEFDDMLNGKKVKATVVEELVKGPKVKIFKYKNKTRYRKTTGHRQKYTQVKIDKIS
jgi:large subunit ribosomal protein L21